MELDVQIPEVEQFLVMEGSRIRPWEWEAKISGSQGSQDTEQLATSGDRESLEGFNLQLKTIPICKKTETRQEKQEVHVMAKLSKQQGFLKERGECPRSSDGNKTDSISPLTQWVLACGREKRLHVRELQGSSSGRMSSVI